MVPEGPMGLLKQFLCPLINSVLPHLSRRLLNVLKRLPQKAVVDRSKGPWQGITAEGRPCKYLLCLHRHLGPSLLVQSSCHRQPWLMHLEPYATAYPCLRHLWSVDLRAASLMHALLPPMVPEGPMGRCQSNLVPATHSAHSRPVMPLRNRR